MSPMQKAPGIRPSAAVLSEVDARVREFHLPHARPQSANMVSSGSRPRRRGPPRCNSRLHGVGSLKQKRGAPKRRRAFPEISDTHAHAYVAASA
jgi:hypothetical protein